MAETTRCYAIVRRADAAVVYVTTRDTDLMVEGSNNVIAWTPDLGPAPWDVYCYDVGQGFDGWIGEATSSRFVDDGILPDMGRSPIAAFWDKHFPAVPPVARD